MRGTTKPTTRRSVLVTIRGRVQRVGFRAWTERQATARGLSGFVRNQRDGSVEAVYCGNADAVEAMIAATWAGPSGARVEAVTVTEYDDHPSGAFIVRATG